MISRILYYNKTGSSIAVTNFENGVVTIQPRSYKIIPLTETGRNFWASKNAHILNLGDSAIYLTEQAIQNFIATHPNVNEDVSCENQILPEPDIAPQENESTNEVEQEPEQESSTNESHLDAVDDSTDTTTTDVDNIQNVVEANTEDNGESQNSANDVTPSNDSTDETEDEDVPVEYTREYLETLTIEELRKICSDLGMRKNNCGAEKCIQAILSVK